MNLPKEKKKKNKYDAFVLHNARCTLVHRRLKVLLVNFFDSSETHKNDDKNTKEIITV